MRALALLLCALVELPSWEKLSSTDMEPVAAVMGDRAIVQLGESIHMARGFPTVRLQLVDALNGKHRFDMLLFEGSAVDAWIAMDHVLRLREPLTEDFAEARDIAFPPLWRTAEFVDVIKLARSTRNSATPLYIASYDLQPGMGAAKAGTMKSFLQVLRSYAPMPPGFEVHLPILDLLVDRKTGFPNRPPPSRDVLLNAIHALEGWVMQAAPKVDEALPKSPHGRMLRMIPSLLRDQVDLWIAHISDENWQTWKTFQETRDRLGAANIMRIRGQVSSTKKVIVWAHHVHVFHNSVGEARHTLGSDLKRWMGDALYTVGVFAGSGEVLALTKMEDAEKTKLAPAEQFGLEGWLSTRCQKLCFVDFSSEKAEVLRQRTTTRIEGNVKLATIPARDFDGAIWVPEVTAPVVKW